MLWSISSPLLSVALLLLAFSGPIFAESGIVDESFVDVVRPDRASGGFRAFLEIRGESRVLNIVEISPGGSAAQAGLKVGDLILALDGKPLPCWDSDLERVKAIDRLYSAGDVVTVSFSRPSDQVTGQNEDGVQETELTLHAMPPETQEELIRWVAIAEQRSADGESLYCHDVEPSDSGTHYVCRDDSDSMTKKP